MLLEAFCVERAGVLWSLGIARLHSQLAGVVVYLERAQMYRPEVVRGAEAGA